MAQDNHDYEDLTRSEEEIGLTTPVSEEPATNGVNNTNGAGNGHRQGLGDALGLQAGNGGGYGYDPIREMAEGSNEAHKYLVRTVVDEDEIQDDIVEFSELQWALYGYIDVPYLHWLRYHLRISLQGAGRKQVENMFIGERQFRRDMFGGVMRGGMMRRAKNINNEEVEAKE